MPIAPLHLRLDPLPPRGAPGIVAVSGGADSTALLHLLHQHRYPLVVAHLNHRLRGLESDADEAFVREVAASLDGVQYRSIGVDVAALARGHNLEATARRCRYEWFQQIAGSCGAEWIATAHHADDQCETVLHNLSRGSSLSGLRGIAPVRILDGSVALYRPMLSIRRVELTDWLTERDLSWRTDASNADTTLTRNRLRHEVLPWLAIHLPRLSDNLNRLAEDARDYTEVIERLARAVLDGVRLETAGEVRLEAARLEREPGLILREVGRLLWTGEGWPRGEMNRHHWATFEKVVRGEVRSAQFPGGVEAHRTGPIVAFHRRDEPIRGLSPNEDSSRPAQ